MRRKSEKKKKKNHLYMYVLIPLSIKTFLLIGRSSREVWWWIAPYPGLTIIALIFFLELLPLLRFLASRAARLAWSEVALNWSVLSTGCLNTAQRLSSLDILVRMLQSVSLWLPGIPVNIVRMSYTGIKDKYYNTHHVLQGMQSNMFVDMFYII